MSEDAGAELASVIGATGLKGAGALGLYWLAGPTLRAVGKAFGDWTDYRLRNLLGLGEKIQARRTSDAFDDEGQVHPKVVHEVFERGSWTSDDVAQEYLAGLLCSSRTPEGDDEEGAYLAGIVAGMTATQIRLHHALYAPLNGHGDPLGTGLQVEQTAKTFNVFLPYDQVYEVAGKPDDPLGFVAIRGAVAALARERLVGAEYGLGGPTAAYVKNYFPPGASGGLMAYPTALGIDLFLRAYGVKAMDHNQLLRGLDLPPVSVPMPIAVGAIVGAGHF